MHDQSIIQRFIQLRAEGTSFGKIAETLGVSKSTLIDWSRVHQFEINNLRAIHAEAAQEESFLPARERWKTLGWQLTQVEQELAKRNLQEVSTARLFTLAAALRAEISREEARFHFSEPLVGSDDGQDNSIPAGILDWKG